jgi:hypothetical protein
VFLPAAKRAGGAEKEIALQQKIRAPFCFSSGAHHGERHYQKVIKAPRQPATKSGRPNPACDKNS